MLEDELETSFELAGVVAVQALELGGDACAGLAADLAKVTDLPANSDDRRQ